jgi:succinoglycan biosynthesis transport protein ExoP
LAAQLDSDGETVISESEIGGTPLELKRYVFLIWKWAWLIALCSLLAGGIALIASLLMTPVYEASSTLRIGSGGAQGTSDYNDLLAGQRLAQTYARLLTKTPVLEGVLDSLGLSMTTTELKKAVKIQTVQNTELIEIAVEHTSPLVAQAIANEIPRIFVEQDRALEASRYATLKAGLEEKMAGLEEQIRQVQAAIASKRAAGAAEEDPDLITLQSDLQQAQANFATLLQSYGNVELAEVQSGSGVVVAAQAVLPEEPVRPQKTMNTLLAAIAGALLGIGAAFLIEYLDDTIKTPDDVQASLGVATLGAVARNLDSKTGSALIASRSPLSSLTETYRTLRTNLQFSDVDHPLRSLVVTSASPTEGKSTTVANLGVVMAQAGQRVILVDSDLRRPTLHKLFGLPNDQGLTDALVDGDLTAGGWLQDTSVERLKLITSGPLPPNPSELLGSQRMQQLVAHLEGLADVVLYDSPPALAVADAVVLSKQVDGTVLIVGSGETRRGLAQRALASLKQVGTNVVGVVLNRVSLSGRGNYYYYHSDYSHYVEDDQGKRLRHRRRGAQGVWARLLRRSKG